MPASTKVRICWSGENRRRSIYINDLGPQRVFTLPEGFLCHQGDNVIALAVWSVDGSTGGLGQVSLETLANHTTSGP